MILVNPVAKVMLQRADETFPVAPPLEWVAEPAGYAPGWTYDGATFRPPSLPDRAAIEAQELAEAKAKARQAVLDELLESRIGQVDAPQAVKDYAARSR